MPTTALSNTHTLDSSNLEKIRSFDEKFSKENKKADYFKIFSDFVQSPYGTKKLIKAFYLGSKSAINFESSLMLNPCRLKKIIELKERLKKVYQFLNITKIPTTLKNVKKITIDIHQKNIINSYKNIFKVAKKIVQTILDVCIFVQLGELFCLYSLGKAFFTIKVSRKILMIINGSFILANDQMNFFKHSNIHKIAENQNGLDKRKIVIFREIKNLDFLKIIENVVFIALNCFIVFELIFQMALISTTLKIALSTISLSFAVSVHFYKESLTYPQISK